MEIVGECIGCKENIYKGDEILRHPNGEKIHDNNDCFEEYIREICFSTNA
ncbi:hypothetical protein [Bacillus sp. UNCCL81]|nr:hypothetical protein [Bacillus sp. UNCCL81]SFD44768.1 hypothetical protein SAMN02799633_03853 [Bacillus sp. UNCCL81]